MRYGRYPFSMNRPQVLQLKLKIETQHYKVSNMSRVPLRQQWYRWMSGDVTLFNHGRVWIINDIRKGKPKDRHLRTYVYGSPEVGHSHYHMSSFDRQSTTNVKSV